MSDFGQLLYGNGQWRTRPEFDLCVVVDDDEDILLAARLLLRDLFGEVLTVRIARRGDGRDAGRSPDVVLLDANFARGATDAREGLAWLDRLLAIDPEVDRGDDHRACRACKSRSRR